MSCSYEIFPKIFKLLQDKKVIAGQCTVMWSGGSKFQVDGGKRDQYVVDLDRHTCSCREWDLSGLSCPHGIVVVQYKGVNQLRSMSIHVIAQQPTLEPMITLYNQSMVQIYGAGLSMKLLSHLYIVDNQED